MAILVSVAKAFLVYVFVALPLFFLLSVFESALYGHIHLSDWAKELGSAVAFLSGWLIMAGLLAVPIIVYFAKTVRIGSLQRNRILYSLFSIFVVLLAAAIMTKVGGGSLLAMTFFGRVPISFLVTMALFGIVCGHFTRYR